MRSRDFSNTVNYNNISYQIFLCFRQAMYYNPGTPWNLICDPLCGLFLCENQFIHHITEKSCLEYQSFIRSLLKKEGEGAPCQNKGVEGCNREDTPVYVHYSWNTGKLFIYLWWYPSVVVKSHVNEYATIKGKGHKSQVCNASTSTRHTHANTWTDVQGAQASWGFARMCAEGIIQQVFMHKLSFSESLQRQQQKFKNSSSCI